MLIFFSLFLLSHAQQQLFPCAAFKIPLPYAATSTRGSSFGIHANGAVSVAFSNSTHVFNLFSASLNVSSLPTSVLVAVRAADTTPTAASFSWSPAGDRLFWSNLTLGKRAQLFVSQTAVSSPPVLVSHPNPSSGAAYEATFAVPSGVIKHATHVVFDANPVVSCVFHLFSFPYTAMSGSIVQLSPSFNTTCSGTTFSFASFATSQDGLTVVMIDSTNSTQRLYRATVSSGAGSYLSTPVVASGIISSPTITATSVYYFVTSGSTQNIYRSPLDGSGFTAMTSFAIGVDLGARGSFSVLSNGDVIFINFAAGAFNIARVPASGSGVLTLLTRGGRVQDFVVSPSEAYVVYSTQLNVPHNVSSILLSTGSEILLSSSTTDEVTLGGLTVTSDSQRVVFVRTDASARFYPTSASINNAGLNIRLSPASSSLLQADNLVLLPNGKRAVFWTGVAGTPTLISASLTNASDAPQVSVGFFAETLAKPVVSSDSLVLLFERTDTNNSGPWVTCAGPAPPPPPPSMASFGSTVSVLILAISLVMFG